MASRIFYNTAQEADEGISGAYEHIIVRGHGFVRDTGVQEISGEKFFYDSVVFYSGLGIGGDISSSGTLYQEGPASFANTFLFQDTGLFNQGFRSLDTAYSAVFAAPVITGANISGTNLTGTTCRFSNATIPTLASTSASISTLTGTTISGNNISGTNITGQTIRAVNLSSSLFNVSLDSTVVGQGSFGALLVTGTGQIPSSPTSAGTIGKIVIGGGYLYACTGNSRWGRTHLTGWV